MADIAAEIRAESGSRSGLLTVERKDTTDVIGYCGLLPHENGPDEADLAYELLRAAHRCGYATEAAMAVVSWASGAGYRRLRAGVRDRNSASRRVLEKVGFRETGEVEPDAIHGDSLMTVRDLPQVPD